jgi:hypothetical protein
MMSVKENIMGGGGMKDSMRALLKNMDLNGPAGENAIKEAEDALGSEFPADYSEFLLEANGGEGTVGISYIVLWPAEDIARMNEAYGVGEFAPGLAVFGTDGGGMAYAFDMRDNEKSIVEVPFIGMDLSETKFLADTFEEFLGRLNKVYL